MRGRDVELDATNIAHGGISVARLDGRVVFVSDAIPGERVVARVTDDDKPTFWRADTVRVLEPSIHRRPHPWAEAALDRDPAARAGGAEFGHIALPHQRELKQQVLREALARFGGVERDTVVEPLPGADDGTGWRTRVRLHVSDDGVVGPYAARSHTVVPVTDLPLAVDELREIAPLSERFDAKTDHIDLLSPALGGVRMIVGTQTRSVVREVVGNREFLVDDSGFWQVHRHAAETLSAAVGGAIDDQLFDPKAANLDLYGGVGLLAAAVGDRFGPATRITSVESDARATEHAAENLADWIGASTATARTEHWVRSLATASPSERARLSAATVVLDPPRAGAGRAVVDALAAVSPAQIVYVACDPVAFARDVGLFAAHGYRLEGLRAFDLFPMTHHVEAVGHLVRENPAR
ncbi:MAG: class I SAM-dependent RNA methyltransferase [Pseudolysinimonas sp.]